MAKQKNDNKEPRRYPSPILLLAAAVYLVYMAYSLWQTTTDGTAAGTGLIISWLGCVAFIILAGVLVYLSIKFNKLNKEALDAEIARENEELDRFMDSLKDENEEDNND